MAEGLGDPAHGDLEAQGRQARNNIRMPRHDNRSDFAANPQNQRRMRAKLATTYQNGNPILNPHTLTAAQMETYLGQFETKSEEIRNLVRGTMATGGIATPQEVRIADEAGVVPSGVGYFLVEWRITPIDSAPADGGCGCGCGRGCGG